MASEVKVGQVWIDNDKRMSNREIRIVRIEAGHAIGKIVLAPNRQHRKLMIDTRKYTRIRLDRFRPISTGYRLKDAPDAH